jgi:hypothetical protein
MALLKQKVLLTGQAQTGHSGSRLDIIIFFLIFFRLSKDVSEKKILIFPIKYGKLVHGEV